MQNSSRKNPPVARLDVRCVAAGACARNEQRDVIVESHLTIDIKEVGAYTVMCTPTDELALAAGFALAEGIIENRDDIAMIAHCPDDPQVIRMQLARAPKVAAKRNLTSVSSCGICGSENIEDIIDSLPAVGDTLHLNTEQLVHLPVLLQSRQQLFEHTGSAHAAALVRQGEVLALCEDIGRHTAFDKTIGSCLLRGIPTAGGAAALSGRVSFEIVVKAARAGIELLAAVSAPTTLAIRTAQRCNITLCGFVRDGRATIYSVGHRIVD